MSEARFGLARCPGCGGALEPLDHVALAIEPAATAPLASAERTAPISLCAVCFGVWFDWWAGETSSLWASLVALPRSTQATPARTGRCPRDGSALSEQPYLDQGPSVRRCPRCMGLFARRAQIDELAIFAERLPEPTLPFEDKNVLARLWRLLR